jgi:hypothetical protein
MKVSMIAALALSATLASAQAPTAKPTTVAPVKPVVKPVTPASSAIQTKLPEQVRGVTVTTEKLVYVLQRP